MEWISFEKKPPQVGEVVVAIVDKFGHPVVVRYDGFYSGRFCWLEPIDDAPIGKVTHWMALPDLPNKCDCVDCAEGVHHVECKTS